MKTITILANKGGSGCTVTIIALASSFLSQGKRVTIMDYSDLAGCSASPLRAWLQLIATCELHQQRLHLIECEAREEVEDCAAAAQSQGIDVLLIDTSVRIYELQPIVLELSIGIQNLPPRF